MGVPFTPKHTSPGPQSKAKRCFKTQSRLYYSQSLLPLVAPGHWAGHCGTNEVSLSPALVNPPTQLEGDGKGGKEEVEAGKYLKC